MSAHELFICVPFEVLDVREDVQKLLVRWIDVFVSRSRLLVAIIGTPERRSDGVYWQKAQSIIQFPRHLPRREEIDDGTQVG